jgi:hypothetical protein
MAQPVQLRIGICANRLTVIPAGAGFIVLMQCLDLFPVFGAFRGRYVTSTLFRREREQDVEVISCTFLDILGRVETSNHWLNVVTNKRI